MKTNEMKAKKQKREAFLPGNDISASELLEKSVQDSFLSDSAARKGEISLNLGNGQTAEFKLHIIEPQDILTKTAVFEGNDRIQETLNSLTLNDILPSIRKHGISYPAIGRMMGNGVIDVVDGSRRRFACHLAKQPYLIYVTDSDKVTQTVAKHLSDVGNLYKPLSQYEQGRRYQSMVDAGMSQADVAREECISRAKVTQAISAYVLPMIFYKSFASGFDIGRPTITRLRQIYELAVSANIQDELLDAVKQISPESIARTVSVDTVGLSRIVKALMTESKRNGESVSHLEQALSFAHLQELLAHPDLVDQLGIAEKINQVLDKKAFSEIRDVQTMLNLDEDSKPYDTTPFFEGDVVNVGRKVLKDGSVQFVFRKMTEHQKEDIDKLILEYLNRK
ncbi:ParB/RepB/Spo0J family partition protein [Oceanisphaera sp. IT1-181]|uniref:ParB/RepB/Spo0J family partition protein n=1 Tax=Oceanisphaera sp. IT1-181 TaxID=3081199 RepID=UPI0029CA3467|nr:ParB/RepB/Spo0J family partition protein [Oceanisphaera sp. IT1-181]